jgi:hypothetical protein
MLGVRPDQRIRPPTLRLNFARLGQAAEGDIQSDGQSAGRDESGRPMAGAAAQL